MTMLDKGLEAFVAGLNDMTMEELENLHSSMSAYAHILQGEKKQVQHIRIAYLGAHIDFWKAEEERKAAVARRNHASKFCERLIQVNKEANYYTN